MSSYLNIYGNTIVDNTCVSSLYHGAGIYIKNTDGSQRVDVANNIIACDSLGYGIYNDNNGEPSYSVYLNQDCVYQNTPGSYGSSGTQQLDHSGDIGYGNDTNPGLSTRQAAPRNRVGLHRRWICIA